MNPIRTFVKPVCVCVCVCVRVCVCVGSYHHRQLHKVRDIQVLGVHSWPGLLQDIFSLLEREAEGGFQPDKERKGGGGGGATQEENIEENCSEWAGDDFYSALHPVCFLFSRVKVKS